MASMSQGASWGKQSAKAFQIHPDRRQSTLSEQGMGLPVGTPDPQQGIALCCCFRNVWREFIFGEFIIK